MNVLLQVTGSPCLLSEAHFTQALAGFGMHGGSHSTARHPMIASSALPLGAFRAWRLGGRPVILPDVGFSSAGHLLRSPQGIAMQFFREIQFNTNSRGDSHVFFVFFESK